MSKVDKNIVTELVMNNIDRHLQIPFVDIPKYTRAMVLDHNFAQIFKKDFT